MNANITDEASELVAWSTFWNDLIAVSASEIICQSSSAVQIYLTEKSTGMINEALITKNCTKTIRFHFNNQQTSYGTACQQFC